MVQQQTRAHKHEYGREAGRDPVGPVKTAARINTQSEMEAKSKSGFFFLVKGFARKKKRADQVLFMTAMFLENMKPAASGLDRL